MLRKVFLAATIVGVSLAAPSIAQSTSDVRCLILSTAFAKGANTTAAKTAAEAGALFYLGKVDGRWDDAKLHAAIGQQRKAIMIVNAGAEMQGCIKRMKASAARYQAAARP